MTLRQMMNRFATVGELVWIGVRPALQAPMQVVEAVEAVPGRGLTGDRFQGRQRQREVTLLQAEHLNVLSSLAGREVLPEQLRRNLVVKGVNLLALKGQEFAIGQVRLRCTGAAHPCSRMETTLGEGGYNMVRGHGGITATIISGGVMHLGDAVQVLTESHNFTD